MTTLYEAGIEECKTLTPLENKEAYNEIKRSVKEYFEENNKIAKYYMLLCHENRDYTIFTSKKKITNTNLHEELFECLKNRGEIYGAALTQDKQAIEIWVNYYDDLEPHCYFFFSYDEGVCEI